MNVRLYRITLLRAMQSVAAILTLVAAGEACSQGTAGAVIHQAQIEARVLSAPHEVMGSDGRKHLAYELRITSFQSDDDPLALTQVAIFPDEARTALAVIQGGELYGLLNRAAKDGDGQDGVPIASGRSETFFLWLTLPPGMQAHTLRHQLTFLTRKGKTQRADDAQTTVVTSAPLSLGPPLRGGRWLAAEGPGNHLSHHWGGMVAIDGTLSSPQRYAIDWFGLDEGNHSLRHKRETLSSSAETDWVGFGHDVLAVADGVVVDSRDGIASMKILAPQESPDDLTARTLYGNFVVIRIAPGVFAHYAHLQAGSVAVHPGEKVQRGAVIGRLGHTGMAGAPHLHFHISDLPTFERSQGLPFTIDHFTLIGPGKIEDTFDPTVPVDLHAAKPRRQANELPLDGSIVEFP